ncbi:MAG: caspase family protein, partial [Verrucomicrobiota bacterium]
MQIEGENYLNAINTDFEGEVEAKHSSLALNKVIDLMERSGTVTNIIILDACRNTPLNRTGRTRSVTGHAGLSEMTPPAGSLIAFATDAGQVAFDGVGSNGLYTEELLKNLRTPGLTIEQVFKRTRAGVLARSQGGQIPAEYSRLVGDDIYLAGQAAPAPVVTKSPEPKEETVTDPAQLTKLAMDGDCAKCIRGLEALAASRGPGDYAPPVFEALLEQVKYDLKQATAPSPEVVIAAGTCAAVLRLLPECLPQDDARANSLAAKAHNRRGDALLLLGRPDEALKEFDSALPLAPTDAYVLFNRGRAHLALDQRDEAIADFTAAASDKFGQPKAKSLARQALAEMK